MYPMDIRFFELRSYGVIVVLSFLAARFMMEFFRGQPAVLAGGIPAAQVVGGALVLAAALGFYRLRGRPYGKG